MARGTWCTNLKMASSPSEFSLQNHGAMLKVTSFEPLLYGAFLLLWDCVSDYSYHILFSNTCCSGDWYGLESWCPSLQLSWSWGALWWADIIIIQYTHLAEGFDASFAIDLVVLVLCWSEIDVCHHSRTMHHHQNKFSFLSLSSKIRTDIQPSFCQCWSLSDDCYTPFRQCICGPTWLDAPILLYGACHNIVMCTGHFISHCNGSMYWGENSPALDQGHHWVLIIVRCSASHLHHEWHTYRLPIAYCDHDYGELQLNVLSSQLLIFHCQSLVPILAIAQVLSNPWWWGQSPEPHRLDMGAMQDRYLVKIERIQQFDLRKLWPGWFYVPYVYFTVMFLPL